MADNIREAQPVGEDDGGLYAPSGSTLLNLACTDRGSGGYLLGRMINIIGDSSAGKSFLALTMLACIVRLKFFKDYRIIYDDAEAALGFDIEKLFGKRLADRMEPPRLDEDGEPEPSSTIQDLQDNIHNLCAEGIPFIYVLDSLDSLTSEEEIGKVAEVRKARKEGKDAAGDYGVTKPKAMSQMLRMMVRDIMKTLSLLIIISQTRDNINGFGFDKKTRSGGRALKFYSTIEMWLTNLGKIKGKRDRQIGMNCGIKITKNKITGKLRQVKFPILYSYGVDDIGSMIDFLVDEKVWKKNKTKIIATGLRLEETRSVLIKKIEDNELERDVRKIVTRAWREIESGLDLGRKLRF